MKSIWAFLLGSISIIAMLFLMGADSIPHPTPASDDSLPVGNGTKWVTSTVPNTSGTTAVLTYSTAGNSFGSTTPTHASIWYNECDTAAVNCTDTTHYYRGSMNVKNSNGLAGFSATKARVSGNNDANNGTGGGNVTFTIQDIGVGAVTTFVVPCTGFTQNGTTATIAGGALPDGHDIGIYRSATNCTAVPTVMTSIAITIND